MDTAIPPDRQERFTQLYRRYQPQLLAYARRRFPAPDADEVVADAFAVVWRQLDAVPDNPLPWLYRVAGNTAANQRRRNTRWQWLLNRLQISPPSVATADPAVATVGMDALTTALATLNDNDQEVLRLVAWEELNGTELAAALGCSANAAKVRLHRARRRLGQLLGDAELAAPPTGQAGPATSSTQRFTSEVSR